MSFKSLFKIYIHCDFTLVNPYFRIVFTVYYDKTNNNYKIEYEKDKTKFKILDSITISILKESIKEILNKDVELYYTKLKDVYEDKILTNTDPYFTDRTNYGQGMLFTEYENDMILGGPPKMTPEYRYEYTYTYEKIKKCEENIDINLFKNDEYKLLMHLSS